MPLGFERVNERTRRPNELINFIRPLSGPDEAKSQDYLERVAAIVYPIMKANHVVVMALEEYPPNPEFWGRNFNAGEVVQLVLKSTNGGWLPLRHVQMVMIHELAHCKEMNHSKFFWNIRNSYANELKNLWSSLYTGEGFWGTGRGLEDGAYLRNDMPNEQYFPSSLCGGVYRNRGKRKLKQNSQAGKSQLSYAQRKQKAILKKFGVGGTALGADEAERERLESGKKIKGKPRVAASNRARELRAAAALARFEKAKNEDKFQCETEDNSDTESETETEAAEDDMQKTIKSGGRALIKVCKEEDPDDCHVKLEMEDMMSSLHDIPQAESGSKPHVPLPDSVLARPGRSEIKHEFQASQTSSTSSMDQESRKLLVKALVEGKKEACKICSLINEADATLCSACLTVLDPVSMWDHWRCQGELCKNSEYINSGNYTFCQLCGDRRPADKQAAC